VIRYGNPADAADKDSFDHRNRNGDIHRTKVIPGEQEKVLAILNISSLFHVMISAIKNERHLLHVSRIRSDVCSVFKFED
jgi:hypothetical protein